MRSLLRNHVFRLLLLVVVAAAGGQLAVWVAGAIEERRTPPPVQTVRAFLEALRSATLRNGEGCERALALLTASSRERLEAEVRGETARNVRISACRTQSMRFFHGLGPETARLQSQTAGQAVVGIERREADPKSYLIPGFWPTRWVVSQVEAQLVEEGGGWKVVLP